MSAAEVLTSEGFTSLQSPHFEVTVTNGLSYLMVSWRDVYNMPNSLVYSLPKFANSNVLPMNQLAGQVVKINFTCSNSLDNGCLVIKIVGRGDQLSPGELSDGMIKYCDFCVSYRRL